MCVWIKWGGNNQTLDVCVCVVLRRKNSISHQQGLDRFVITFAFAIFFVFVFSGIVRDHVPRLLRGRKFDFMGGC